MKFILDKTQPNITQVRVACGYLFIIIGYDENAKIRFFFEVSHRGGGCQANLEAIAKLLSLWYQDGRLNKTKAIEELEEIDCLNCHKWKGTLLAENKSLPEDWNRSCANAISKVLKNVEIKE